MLKCSLKGSSEVLQVCVIILRYFYFRLLAWETLYCVWADGRNMKTQIHHLNNENWKYWLKIVAVAQIERLWYEWNQFLFLFFLPFGKYSVCSSLQPAFICLEGKEGFYIQNYSLGEASSLRVNSCLWCLWYWKSFWGEQKHLSMQIRLEQTSAASPGSQLLALI